MPRQNFKSVWMQSRCTVPSWSWWDLRTGFPKTAPELLIQPLDHGGSDGHQRGLGPLWASLEEQWLHWDMGRGTGVLLACSRGWRTGLASAHALLMWEKAVAAVALGWPWWHQGTSCLMHRVTSAWFRVAMRKVPWTQNQLPRRVKISACRSKN